VLLRLVLLTASAQLLCGGIYAFLKIKYNNDWRVRLYLLNLCYVLLALVAILLNIVVLISHPTLRKEFYRVTRLEKYTRRTQSQEISSIQGSRLDIPLSHHSDFYFGSYRNSW
ncbi:hypothetical protein PMAYCL1PPCAC_09798, partial [Pristionchus mayeri]